VLTASLLSLKLEITGSAVKLLIMASFSKGANISVSVGVGVGANVLKCKRGQGIRKQCVLKVINSFYLREWKPCYYSREGGQCTECIGHTRFCEARLAN